MSGFIISDYTEDNPSESDFSVSRPQTLDLDHVETIHAKGHRYIIRYEVASGATAPSLLQTQEHFEKLASAIGYSNEKSGAVGDVTETFHLENHQRNIWVRLEPAITSYVLTVVEVKGDASSVAGPNAPGAPVLKTNMKTPVLIPVPASAISPAPSPETKAVEPLVSAPVVATGPEDPFYTALTHQGHLVLPIKFMAGKPDVDADSQPVVNRVVAMMQRHPDLQLEIDGHTDNTGDSDFNLDLSMQRARAVRGMIMAGEIAKKRLTAVGLGGTKPIAIETSRQGRETNRRIELVMRRELPVEAPTVKVEKKKSGAPKPVAKEKVVAPEDEATSKGAFHAPAPGGMNYYPSGTNAPGTPASE